MALSNQTTISSSLELLLPQSLALLKGAVWELSLYLLCGCLGAPGRSEIELCGLYLSLPDPHRQVGSGGLRWAAADTLSLQESLFKPFIG